MHYSVLVILPNGVKPDPADREMVKRAVADLIERWRGKHFDWWQVGGRWTGVLSEYDPEKDERNVETCRFCAGTGKRGDAIAALNPDQMKALNGCNGCKGTGRELKWPTQWVPFEGDVQPTEKITPEMAKKFYTYVLPSPKKWRAWEGWNSRAKEFKEDKSWDILAVLKDHPGHYAVVVDTHN